MTAEVQTILRMVPPPASPWGIPSSATSWDHVESELGVGLPSDYRQLVESYGTGWFGDETLFLLNPFVPGGRPDNLLWQTFCGELLTFPFEDPKFPTPGGILIAGISYKGDYLLWHTKGRPDSWPLEVREVRGPRREFFPSLASLMVELFAYSGRVKSFEPPPRVFKSSAS